MDLLLSALPAAGTWVTFEEFKAQAQALGARVEWWRRAKSQGLVETRIEGEYGNGGVHQIRKVV